MDTCGVILHVLFYQVFYRECWSACGGRLDNNSFCTLLLFDLSGNLFFSLVVVV